jgi:hypothetical protein
MSVKLARQTTHRRWRTVVDEENGAEAPQQWTAADVAAHCDWLGDKGYMNKNTASAQRIAVGKVFSTVEGEGWEVRGVDMEDVLDRFEQLSRASRDLSPDSIPTYQSRCRRAVEAYVQYHTDGTIQKSQRRGRSNGSEKASEKPAKKAATNTPTAPTPPSPALNGGSAEELVPYPFPLRKGLLVQLHLPTDLRKKEAERIANYVMSLVMDEPLELPAGTSE